ncbi:MAG TPA: cupin domain-containing protein, partial [Vicinamibacterales bacterium]|nr:cupin domain-containing protein [Vicinamibacterales bacterium]
FSEMIASAHEAPSAPQAPQAPSAPKAPQAPNNQVFKHDLPPVNLEGWEVTVRHVPYPPGRVGTAHKHAGFVLACVVEGAVVAKVSGQGPERVYKAGEMFFEQPGATHEVSKNASQTEPAKLLALIFAPKGATLTTQVKG